MEQNNTLTLTSEPLVLDNSTEHDSHTRTGFLLDATIADHDEQSLQKIHLNVKSIKMINTQIK